MAFSDYSADPKLNLLVGGTAYIGPNMPRSNVRKALQQIAADGKALAEELRQAQISAGPKGDKGDPGAPGDLKPEQPRRLSYGFRERIRTARQALLTVDNAYQWVVGDAKGMTGGLGYPKFFVWKTTGGIGDIGSWAWAKEQARLEGGGNIVFDTNGPLNIPIDYNELFLVGNLTIACLGGNVTFWLSTSTGSFDLRAKNILFVYPRFRTMPGLLAGTRPDGSKIERKMIALAPHLCDQIAFIGPEFRRASDGALDMVSSLLIASSPTCRVTVQDFIFWETDQPMMLGNGDPTKCSEADPKRLRVTLHNGIYAYCGQRQPKTMGFTHVEMSNIYTLTLPFRRDQPAVSGAFTVDVAADTLTVADDVYAGLETTPGSPPVVSLATLSSTGTLPGGLTTAATYYVIKTATANTLKLATSEANALAGTAINITSAGTGVHILTSANVNEYGANYGSDAMLGGTVRMRGCLSVAILPGAGAALSSVAVSGIWGGTEAVDCAGEGMAFLPDASRVAVPAAVNPATHTPVPAAGAARDAWIAERWLTCGAGTDAAPEGQFAFTTSETAYPNGSTVLIERGKAGRWIRTNTPTALFETTAQTNDALNLARGGTLTITAGALTLLGDRVFAIGGEGGLADDLATISFTTDTSVKPITGGIIYVRAAGAAAPITLIAGGNIAATVPVVITASRYTALLWDGSSWVPIDPAPYASGTSTTLALTAVTNCSGLALEKFTWSRSGDGKTVNWSARPTGNTTAAGDTVFRIAVPVASNFTIAADAAGAGVTDSATPIAASVKADPATDTLVVRFNATGAIGFALCLTGQYEVK